jgi:hypothetical protein
VPIRNPPRDHLTQRDAALIKPNNMERVLANIDADYGDCSLECLSHGIACWRGTSTAGPSHYRTCGVSSVTAWASASSADGVLLLRKCWQKWG